MIEIIIPSKALSLISHISCMSAIARLGGLHVRFAHACFVTMMALSAVSQG